MNQISDVLHSCLDGHSFNRLLDYEKKKYEELETLIHKNDYDWFNKEEYRIPILPEHIDESKIVELRQSRHKSKGKESSSSSNSNETPSAN